MSIIKGLFIGLKNLKVIPFNRMTPELHDELGSNLAKVMMVAKMSNARLTKAQREYIVNQAKQLQEFEDRYITGIKDKSGNVIKSDEGIKNTESAKIFNLQGEKLDSSKPIIGGTQQGKKINQETFRRLAERGPQLIKQRIADKKINEIDEVSKRIDSGVAATVEKILNMKPTDAMKEANLIIGRKGPYKNLSQEDAKTILQDTEDHIFKKNIDTDPEDFEQGGRVGLMAGKFVKLAQLLKDPKKVKQAIDNIFPTGDVKYDASMAAESLVELNPKIFGNKLYDDLDSMTQLDIYDAVISPMMSAQAKALKMKKATKPEKTLQSIKEGKGINMSDPEIAKEFERFMKQTDPEGAKKLEQTLELDNFDPKGRKKNAMGGRIGLKDGMDRRTFMKIMAGLASIPVVGKIFKGAKVASKAAPVVKEAVTSGGTPPPYFFNLVKKIKNLGDDVTEKQAIKEREIVTEYKDYKLTEDLDTGELTIQKTSIDGDFDTPIPTAEEVYMQYKPGKGQVDEATGAKVADEYIEDTSYVGSSGRNRGEIVNTVDGVPDEVIKEGTVSEDNVADFIIKEAQSIKKAEGGRIGLLSGGGILRTIIKNLARERGVSPSDYLKIANYKGLPDSAKRFMTEAEFLILKDQMTHNRIEMVENIRDMIKSRVSFDKSKADLAASMNKAAPGYGDEAVKMMFPEESFKSPVPAGAGEKDILMMEQLIKNLKLKGRKENASGGLAGMLGE